MNTLTLYIYNTYIFREKVTEKTDIDKEIRQLDIKTNYIKK